MSDTFNGEVYEGGDVDTENGELSHVASKLEELIIVDSSTERNKKERTESSTQTEEFEFMFSRPNDASFEREDMRNDEKAVADTGGVDRVDIHPPFFSKKNSKCHFI